MCVQSEGDAGLSVGRSTGACDEMHISTAYLYHQYESDPSALAEAVSLLARMALQGLSELDSPEFTPSRDHLVAVIRPDAYTANAGPVGDPQSSIWRPFVGDLVAMLAQNENGQTRSIRGVDLARLGLSEAEAWDLAIANLRQQLGAVTRTANGAGAEHVTSASGLAPASLLLPETCSAGGPQFDAFVVARDSYFYADTSQPQATAMLAGYSAQLVQGREVYSHRLLSCLGGAWYSSVFNGENAWLPELPPH